VRPCVSAAHSACVHPARTGFQTNEFVRDPRPEAGSPLADILLSVIRYSVAGRVAWAT